MKITICKVDESNLLEVIQDESMFIIKRGGLFGRYMMMPISHADVRDLTSSEVLFIRITEE